MPELSDTGDRAHSTEAPLSTFEVALDCEYGEKSLYDPRLALSPGPAYAARPPRGNALARSIQRRTRVVGSVLERTAQSRRLLTSI